MIKRSDWVRMLRYAVVGVGNTATDFLVFGLLVFGVQMDSLIANGCAFAVAVTQGYLLNSCWTFHDSEAGLSWKQYVSFIVVNLGGVAASTLALFLLQDYIGPLAAKLSSVLLVFAWGYLMSRRFVFGQRPSAKPSLKFDSLGRSSLR